MHIINKKYKVQISHCAESTVDWTSKEINMARSHGYLITTGAGAPIFCLTFRAKCDTI